MIEARSDGSRRIVATGVSFEGAEWIKGILLTLEPSSVITIESQLPVPPEAVVPPPVSSRRICVSD